MTLISTFKLQHDSATPSQLNSIHPSIQPLRSLSTALPLYTYTTTPYSVLFLLLLPFAPSFSSSLHPLPLSPLHSLSSQLVVLFQFSLVKSLVSSLPSPPIIFTQRAFH